MIDTRSSRWAIKYHLSCICQVCLGYFRIIADLTIGIVTGGGISVGLSGWLVVEPVRLWWLARGRRGLHSLRDGDVEEVDQLGLRLLLRLSGLRNLQSQPLRLLLPSLCLLHHPVDDHLGLRYLPLHHVPLLLGPDHPHLHPLELVLSLAGDRESQFSDTLEREGIVGAFLTGGEMKVDAML